MSKRCISCKREIVKTQKICLICGTKQSYLSYYSKPLVVVFLLLLIGSWITKNEIQKQVKETQATQERLFQKRIVDIKNSEQELNNRIRQLILDKQKLTKEIEHLNIQIAERNTNSNDSQNLLEKEKGKTSWLRKENNRFTVKIKSLTEQVSSLEEELNKQSKKPILNDSSIASKIKAVENKLPLQSQTEQKQKDPDRINNEKVNNEPEPL